ncbi:recombinase family protein [Oscillospiraceae bacterium OttesenSCG-928-G22]|nr:recombinase family protein [Oscillospiraceae bacterium OttesenSCG-928-G22]
MTETYDIAGYCRISVDDELDRDNTSIENQRAIIEDYVTRTFPGSTLTFYDDRDRSGYTFEQRESYQQMRKQFVERKYDILIIKDFSRFSRRNGRGLVELEDLRDMGVRIISIGDGIDYPTDDDWLAIQLHFFINEMPVTDASKKVKSVIKRRQADGKWICSVPYGYVITNTKTMAFEIDPAAAEIVRNVFGLYNDGWGYKKIANHLTDLCIPTPRMAERNRIEARGEECRLKTRPEWSIATIQSMLENDFYIGTLRQGKYTRKKINGTDLKVAEDEHIVFENHHEAVVDYRVFALAQEQRRRRTKTNYRGVRINENTYSGYLFCGDCGAPMFSMSRRDLRPAYTCGSYHRRGLKGCTSHHTRVDTLDTLLKSYVRRVRDNSAGMISELEAAIRNEASDVSANDELISRLEEMLLGAKEELKATKRQKIREIMRHPENESVIEETYAELEAELDAKITGLQNQVNLAENKRNVIIRTNRAAKTAIDIFNDILNKETLNGRDLDLIIERIDIFETHLEIKLKQDVDTLLHTTSSEDLVNFPRDTEDIEHTRIVQASANRKDKVFRVNVVDRGDSLEIYTDKDGEVIFKKYSPMGEMSSFAIQICETLNKTTGASCAVLDRDSVIAVSGTPRRDLLEKRVSEELERIMEGRQVYQYKQGDTKVPVSDGSDRYTVEIAAPIISEGDVSGCVVFIANESGEAMGETEYKLAQTVAGFLGKQMES